jgi:serine/threonine protein kinase
MNHENLQREAAEKPASHAAETCSVCGRPLTHRGPDGECLLCLFSLGLSETDPSADKSATHRQLMPGPLKYAHFEVQVGADGFPVELGAGAMAIIYRARDTVLNSFVALKVIDPRMSENPIARSRFLREARAAAQIRHPNVARVTHYGEQDGECFYAMELCEGETLEARVRRDGPMPAALALEVIEQATRALAAAEAHGVVHRDLKPSNIMIGSDASDTLLVKVVDFGVSKVMAEEASVSGDQTQAGFVGTPAFASPEQFAFSGKSPIDTRSDIYSLGVTLWYLLSGRTPFAGRTIGEFRAKQTAELPLDQLRASHIPAAVIELLKSMLSVDPAARPQSGRELLLLVQRCHQKIDPHNRARRKRFARIAATLAVGVLAVALGTWQHERARISAQMEKSIAVLPLENLSPGIEDAFFAAGMEDELRAGLARLGNLKVIGSESTRSYLPGESRNLLAIARELGVRHLLEGSVSRAKDVVRVSLRIVDIHDIDHPRIETYERPIRNAFALPSEITRSVAARLGTQLTPNEKSALREPPTKDEEAYDLYLRAREGPSSFRDESGVRRDSQRKIDLLEKAVARDPKFVLAYCELAKAHGRFFTNQIGAKPEELLVDHRSLAEVALQNARRIDASAGELHLAQAYHFFRVTKDYEQARIEADLARRTLPNNAELEIISARVARSQGRWDDAVGFFQRAVALEPRGNDSRFSLAETYRYMRRYEDYDLLITQIIGTDPNHPGDLPLERAVGPLEQRADTRPLRAALAERAAANDLTEHDKVLVGLTLAYSDRSAEMMQRVMQATDLVRITNSGFAYPKTWFEALAARIHGDESAAKVAFRSARAEVESAVLADPGNGRALDLLALIDAGLGRREEAIAEAIRATAQMKSSATDAPIAGCTLAIVYAWSGQPDLALATLEPLLNKPAGRNMPAQPTYGDFELNPVWDPLRNDPRFQALIKRLAPPTSPN